MVRRPPWSRAPVGVGVGVLFLALLVQASQLSHPTFISAREPGQNLRPARAAATPAAAQASAQQPQQLTAFPSLALSLLACSALRYAATRRAAAVSKGAPRARCVLNAMTSPAPGATVKDWQSAEPQEQPPKEPMLISLEPEVLNELSSEDLTARSGEGRRRPADDEARGRRQCGARLLRACSAAPQSWPDGKSAAMDMSRVRSKIQVGIRCTSSARTGSNGREAKTRPECAPIGCCDGHKVRVECCSFTRRSRENGTSSN